MFIRGFYKGILVILTQDLNETPKINDKFLSIIWKDIGKLRFPPNYTDRPPKKLGLAREGKLKAAQWINVCFALVPTLTKEWSRQLPNTNSQKWLENFYHLVSLTRIVYSLSTDDTVISRFRFHSQEYVKGLKDLFPSHRLKPNHHYILHLDSMMEMFGPMRSWWSFPYERLNGDIQQTKNNNIPGNFSCSITVVFALPRFSGQIERSFLRSFQYRQELKLRLSDPELKEFVQLPSAQMALHLAPLHASTIISAEWEPQDALPPSTITLLQHLHSNQRIIQPLHPYGEILEDAAIGDYHFRPFFKSPSHGFAAYFHNNILSAGYIREIFRYQWEGQNPETYALIEPLKASSDSLFTSVPWVGVKIFEQSRQEKAIRRVSDLFPVVWASWSANKVLIILPKELYMPSKF
jgi:hypothetical protein